MATLTELKKLAEAASVLDHNEAATWYSADYIREEGAFYLKNARFIAAANPAKVLEMIRVMEILHREAKAVADDHHNPRYIRLDEALAAYNKLSEE